mmetsp:Transcript_36512/g.83913  ORF Transcript_36512/g.83913 Transcript_36512/m.83913 type:complete len:304 (+) Transcript_36512:48-959(+)
MALWGKQACPRCEQPMWVPRESAGEKLGRCRRCELGLIDMPQKCIICFEKITAPRASARILRGDACGHPYCLSCIRTYFHYKVDDGVYHLRCPADGCSFKFSEGEWRKILGPSLLIVEDSATRNRCQQTLDRLKQFLRKEHGGHLATVLRRAMQQSPGASSELSNLTALEEATTTASSSSSIQGSPSSQELSEEELPLDDGSQHFGAWALESCQACPSCNVIVRKEEGCDHISCTCGSHFCYGCGAPIDGSTRNGCLCKDERCKGSMRLGMWLRKWNQIKLEAETAVEGGARHVATDAETPQR